MKTECNAAQFQFNEFGPRSVSARFDGSEISSDGGATLLRATDEKIGLLAFNPVRLEMERVADEAGVAPTRISFITALHVIRDECIWNASAPPGTTRATCARTARDSSCHRDAPSDEPRAP